MTPIEKAERAVAAAVRENDELCAAARRVRDLANKWIGTHNWSHVKPGQDVLDALGDAPLDTGHRVTIRLSYLNTTPYKWRGRCTCGWRCMSWNWSLADGSGALPMSLEHLEEKK